MCVMFNDECSVVYGDYGVIATLFVLFKIQKTSATATMVNTYIETYDLPVVLVLETVEKLELVCQ